MVVETYDTAYQRFLAEAMLYQKQFPNSNVNPAQYAATKAGQWQYEAGQQAQFEARQAAEKAYEASLPALTAQIKAENKDYTPSQIQDRLSSYYASRVQGVEGLTYSPTTGQPVRLAGSQAESVFKSSQPLPKATMAQVAQAEPVAASTRQGLTEQGILDAARLADQQAVALQTGLPLATVQAKWADLGAKYSASGLTYEEQAEEALTTGKKTGKAYVVGIGDIEFTEQTATQAKSISEILVGSEKNYSLPSEAPQLFTPKPAVDVAKSLGGTLASTPSGETVVYYTQKETITAPKPPTNIYEAVAAANLAVLNAPAPVGEGNQLTIEVPSTRGGVLTFTTPISRYDKEYAASVLATYNTGGVMQNTGDTGRDVANLFNERIDFFERQSGIYGITHSDNIVVNVAANVLSPASYVRSAGTVVGAAIRSRDLAMDYQLRFYDITQREGLIPALSDAGQSSRTLSSQLANSFFETLRDPKTYLYAAVPVVFKFFSTPKPQIEVSRSVVLLDEGSKAKFPAIVSEAKPLTARQTPWKMIRGETQVRGGSVGASEIETVSGRARGEIYGVAGKSDFVKVLDGVKSLFAGKKVQTAVIPKEGMGFYEVEFTSGSIPTQMLITKSGTTLQSVDAITNIRGSVFYRGGVKLPLQQVQYTQAGTLTADIPFTLTQTNRLLTGRIFAQNLRNLPGEYGIAAPKTLPTMPKDIQFIRAYAEGTVGKNTYVGFSENVNVFQTQTQVGTATFSTGTAYALPKGTPYRLDTVMLDLRGKPKMSWAEIGRILYEERYTPKVAPTPSSYAGAMINTAQLRAAITKAIAAAPDAPLPFKPEVWFTFGPSVPKPVVPATTPSAPSGITYVKAGKGTYQAQQQKTVVKEKVVSVAQEKQLLQNIRQDEKVKATESQKSKTTTAQKPFSVSIQAPVVMPKAAIKPKPIMAVFITPRVAQPQRQAYSYRQAAAQLQRYATGTRQKTASQQDLMFKQATMQPEPTPTRTATEIVFRQPQLTTQRTDTPPPPIPEIPIPPGGGGGGVFGWFTTDTAKTKKRKDRSGKRRFDLTSDIVSQSFGITSKAYNLEGAITGMGLRPMVRKGRKKRGRS